MPLVIKIDATDAGDCIIRIKVSVQLQTKGATIVACWGTLLLYVKTQERSDRHVKAESSHSDYSNESSETEDIEDEFYVGSIVIDNSTTDVSNVT